MCTLLDMARNDGWTGGELGFPAVDMHGDNHCVHSHACEAGFCAVPGASPDLRAMEWDLAELEASLCAVREAADAQVDAIEACTVQIERECVRVQCECVLLQKVRSRTPDLEKAARSLLVFNFSRDENKHTLRNVFTRFGMIDSVYLVNKPGSSSSYSFVNFAETEGAMAALSACCNGQVVMCDKKGREWRLAAEWQAPDVKRARPKKNKRQNSKEADCRDAPDAATAEARSAGSGDSCDFPADASSSSSVAIGVDGIGCAL